MKKHLAISKNIFKDSAIDIRKGVLNKINKINASYHGMGKSGVEGRFSPSPFSSFFVLALKPNMEYPANSVTFCARVLHIFPEN